MAANRTNIPPRFRDSWSFSGRGRALYQHTRIDDRTGIEVPDGPPREGAPVAPGEPRG